VQKEQQTEMERSSKVDFFCSDVETLISRKGQSERDPAEKVKSD
jgi:hypothetical protein